MSEYWQDKRVNRGQVACAWVLVLAVLALMVAITALMEPDCPDGRNVEASACADGGFMRQVAAERRQPRGLGGPRGFIRRRHPQPSPRAG